MKTLKKTITFALCAATFLSASPGAFAVGTHMPASRIGSHQLSNPAVNEYLDSTLEPDLGACVYTTTNFEGQPFCSLGQAGIQQVAMLWRTEFISVDLINTDKFEACNNPDGAAPCQIVKNNSGLLSPRFFKHTYLYRTNG